MCRQKRGTRNEKDEMDGKRKANARQRREEKKDVEEEMSDMEQEETWIDTEAPGCISSPACRSRRPQLNLQMLLTQEDPDGDLLPERAGDLSQRQ